MHFNFLLTPMKGWVGDKLAGLGVFLVQTGRFLMVQKFIYLNEGQIFEFWRHIFELGVMYLNFGAIYLNFGAIYSNFGVIYSNFGAKYLMSWR